MNDFIREISREAMLELPLAHYEGEICLVAGEAELSLARADLMQETIIGWDTETRPAFRKGESYPPALFQAATARAVYLFQLRHAEHFGLLADLLGEKRIVKAGVAVADDLKKLRQVFAFVEHNVLDLGLAARRAGYAQTGLRNLAGLALGIRIAKGAKTTNWAAAQLMPQQIRYAATDAWVCRELYLKFESSGVLKPAEA